jgi:hypothetical protein
MAYVSILVPAFYTKETEESEIVSHMKYRIKNQIPIEKNMQSPIRQNFRRIRLNKTHFR